MVIGQVQLSSYKILSILATRVEPGQVIQVMLYLGQAGVTLCPGQAGLTHFIKYSGLTHILHWIPSINNGVWS